MGPTLCRADNQMPCTNRPRTRSTANKPCHISSALLCSQKQPLSCLPLRFSRFQPISQFSFPRSSISARALRNAAASRSQSQSKAVDQTLNSMAMRGVDFKWYDGFFLSMLATSVIIVLISWNRYHLCVHPLHIWIVVDYTTVFVFRLLMFVDNGLAAGMGLDLGWQQRYARFCGRIVVLSVLVLLLYPFLCVWTVIGTLWFCSARSCLPGEGQKWGFLIWLLFSYCGLVCIACMATGKWLTRRQAHLQRAQQGIPVSEYGVLVDMIRVPDWAFEAAGQEMRGMGQDTAYHPGLYLTPTQREAVEALIQELPKFRLKAVPTDCSECLICLEEFRVGNEVRGLPCAHNFHVECIDQWLRLNVKCPRCRCSVFPNLDLSALSNLRTADMDSNPTNQVTATEAATRYMQSQQPLRQSYLVRLQGLLLPVIRSEHPAASPAGGGSVDLQNGVHTVVVVPEENPGSTTAEPIMPCVVHDHC